MLSLCSNTPCSPSALINTYLGHVDTEHFYISVEKQTDMVRVLASFR